jgi:hypothetical protein
MLKTENPRIVNFYSINTHLNFETMNIILIDFLEKLTNDLDNTINTGLQTQILNSVAELKAELNKNTSTLLNLNNLSNELELKMLNIKRDYINDMKDVIIANNTNNFDNINKSIITNNDILISRTTNLLNDVIPKSQETFYREINKNITEFQNKVLADTNKIINNTDNNEQLKIFLNSFDNKYINLFSQVQEFGSKIGFITDNIYIKLIEIKKEYVNEITNILTLSANDKTDLIKQSIKENNEFIVDKTTILLNEIIPRTQIGHMKEINDIIISFRENIKEDTDKLLNGINTEKIDNFISSFDENISNMFKNIIQNPIQSFIMSKEDTMTKKIDELRDLNNSNTKVLTDVSNFVTKYNSSSSNKGKLAENKLFGVLNKMFPSAEIKDTTHNASYTGDFVIVRDDNDIKNIMVETKEKNKNADKDDVDKFKRDIGVSKMHSIFLSQTSGITKKNNYEIEIIDNKYIAVYVQYVEYDPEKIGIAIEIIERLHPYILKINIDDNDYENENEDGTSNFEKISKEDLEIINEEFLSFINQKNIIIANIKESQKTLIENIQKLTLKRLDTYLSYRIVKEVNPELYVFCPHCKIIKYLKSIPTHNYMLASHIKGCSKKIPNNLQDIEINENIKEPNTIIENIKNQEEVDLIVGENINLLPLNIKKQKITTKPKKQSSKKISPKQI